ncbi:MAG: ABC transporter ATP-binding protein [Acidobacteria bacterium]|nr:MAG: ABC transporter ATP-binding protein [Acidobacteriota bacterium]
MTAARAQEPVIVVDGVSKFYGDVLGVSDVSLRLGRGVTGLVGPNGSGKTTLMNLLAGLIRPDEGRITVLGLSPDQPERLMRRLGYCTQVDAFPAGSTGRGFVVHWLVASGVAPRQARRLADRAIARVGLLDDADRRIAGYSKGMRQRIKLAQAIAHEPDVLILDEPLGGLDPLARAEVIGVFRDLAADGCTLLVSSHILHEVDLVADTVVLMNEGYVVAEGSVRSVRAELTTHPLQVLVRCSHAGRVASQLVARDDVVELRMHADRGGFVVSSRDADRLHLDLERIMLEQGATVETIVPADEDIQAIYDYLVSGAGGS